MVTHMHKEIENQSVNRLNKDNLRALGVKLSQFICVFQLILTDLKAVKVYRLFTLLKDKFSRSCTFLLQKQSHLKI